MRAVRSALSATLCAASLCSVMPDALAQANQPTKQAPKSPDLDALDCRTLLRLNSEERAFTLLYYHGFISGRLNQMELPTDVMAAATDRIIDHCIDKPADKVLAVFEQARKQR